MPKSHYLCDNCISSSDSDYKGCSCNWNYIDVNAYYPPLDNPELPEGEEGINWKWVEKDICWQNIDEKGRPYPCCEYEYSEFGWDESTYEMLERLDTPETYNEALELMNSYFNNWLNTGIYDMVNNLIEKFIAQNYSVELNLNLLLLTNKLKTNLNKIGNGRYELYDFTRAKCSLTMSEEKTKNILSYLE
jgi:hypothetical protein